MVAAVFIVLAITLLRLIRRPGLYRIAIVVAVVAFVTDVILIVLGFAFLFEPSDLATARIRGSRRPGTRSPSRSRSRCSPTPGLETLANLAQEAREPGKTHAAQPVRRSRAPRWWCRC